MSKYLIINEPHIAPLEGWRGGLCICIMMYHFYIFFSDTLFMPYAPMGVDFFFMLSGYIITRQYEANIATRKVDFKKFFIRRMARLYPLYIASTGFFLVIYFAYIKPSHVGENMLVMSHGPYLLWEVVLQLSMLGNVFGMVMPWNGPAWSVSVEWFVNLVFFLVAWKLRRIPTLLWVAVVVFCGVYLIDFSPQSMDLVMAHQPFFNAPIARGFIGFALGALIFRITHFLPDLSAFVLHTFDAILIIAAMLVMAYYKTEFVVSIDYFILFLLFPPLFIMSFYRKSWICRIASLPPLTFLGKISYSIYLLHLPLGYFYMYSPFFQSLNLTRPLFGLTYIALVLVVSTAMYYGFETPSRVVGRILTSSKKSNVPLAGPFRRQLRTAQALVKSRYDAHRIARAHARTVQLPLFPV